MPLISNFPLVKEKYNGHSSHGNKQHYFGKFWQSFGTVVKEVYNKHSSHDNNSHYLLASMPILRRQLFDVVVECGDDVWCEGWWMMCGVWDGDDVWCL